MTQISRSPRHAHGLREADRHVAGARLDDGRARADLAPLDGAAQHLRRRTILGAAAGLSPSILP
jgi:hypothetical protein